jgi:hypothetical protein
MVTLQDSMILFVFFIAYLVGFFGLVLAAVLLPKYLWKERWPEEFKLRRRAGEGALRKVMELDEGFMTKGFVSIFVPFFLALLPLVAFKWVPEERYGLMLGLSGLLLLVSVGVRVPMVVRTAKELQNYRLGYFGERAVGEALEPLEKNGYQVFHDVPASRGKAEFNLDHVTVGRTGIVVVETKARRKKRGRPGYEEHKVGFDGKRLIFPWGEETGAIEQTVGNVEWLKGWLKERTGREFPVSGILTLPGWYVTESALGAVRVTNPKMLLTMVKGKGAEVLSADDVDLVARQLMSVCRDVEPW